MRGGPDATRPAVAPQKSAVAAVLPGRARGAVTDQGAPQQGLGGRVDHPEQLLFDSLQRVGAGRLGGRIGGPGAVEGCDELLVEPGHLGAQGLVVQGVAGKQCGHRRGDFVGAGGQHAGDRGRSGAVGTLQCSADAGQVRGCARQHFRGRDHIRHRCPPSPWPCQRGTVSLANSRSRQC